MTLARLHHSAFAEDEVAAGRLASVSVCVPARNEEGTIARTIAELVRLKAAGVIDEVVVADDSTDATPRIAAELGALVVRQVDLLPEFGPIQGKGDAMWRALTVVTGEIICFVDADSADFGPRIPCGLIGATALGGFPFAKGAFRRPLDSPVVRAPSGGGRVTELTAKPLLRRLFPALAEFGQPLAGEVAARRELLWSLPFATHYAVDIALLIGAWRELGLENMAEVDLDVRQNRHRPLAEVSVMAQQVTDVILEFAEIVHDPEHAATYCVRPPLAGICS